LPGERGRKRGLRRLFASGRLRNNTLGEGGKGCHPVIWNSGIESKQRYCEKRDKRPWRDSFGSLRKKKRRFREKKRNHVSGACPEGEGRRDKKNATH